MPTACSRTTRLLNPPHRGVSVMRMRQLACVPRAVSAHKPVSEAPYPCAYRRSEAIIAFPRGPNELGISFSGRRSTVCVESAGGPTRSFGRGGRRLGVGVRGACHCAGCRTHSRVAECRWAPQSPIVARLTKFATMRDSTGVRVGVVITGVSGCPGCIHVVQRSAECLAHSRAPAPTLKARSRSTRVYTLDTKQGGRLPKCGDRPRSAAHACTHACVMHAPPWRALAGRATVPTAPSTPPIPCVCESEI